MKSTNTSELPVTIGRVSPGDVILRDSEVSGKHAMINWNANVSFALEHNNMHKCMPSNFILPCRN